VLAASFRLNDEIINKAYPMTLPVSSPAAVSTYQRIVPIDLKDQPRAQSYDIIIGDSLLAHCGQLIAERLGLRRCIIVTDSHVAPLYQKRCEAILTAAGHTMLPTLMVPAGEGSKDFVNLQRLLEQILSMGVDRKTVLVALGGGVVGDLTGVAASLALRGLDLVQIPTTLLAQVDSSVGGKTGIDTAAGKNTIGSFYQPRLVLADVALLDSLPRRELKAGYAEIVKYGLIKDAPFFAWCRANGGRLLNGDHETQIHAVGISCEHKAKIVAADEREAGERALLNLGHTFGHALETASGYGQILLHGEAVAIGMVMAFKLSARLGMCPHADVYDVRDHLAEAGLPVVPPKFSYDIDRLMALMAQDKKAEGGKLTLILVRGIGQAFIARDVNAKEVRALWEDTFKTCP
jgi:3-dehydroquinate synthase